MDVLDINVKVYRMNVMSGVQSYDINQVLEKLSNVWVDWVVWVDGLIVCKAEVQFSALGSFFVKSHLNVTRKNNVSRKRNTRISYSTQ